MEIVESETYQSKLKLMDNGLRFPDSRKMANFPPCFIISTSLEAISAICAFEHL